MIHADNCSSQNKNRCVWGCKIVDSQQADPSATYWGNLCDVGCSARSSCVGHTKCDADAAFGMIKRKYKHTDVHTMEQFRDVVRQASSQQIARIPNSKCGVCEVFVLFGCFLDTHTYPAYVRMVWSEDVMDGCCWCICDVYCCNCVLV